MLLVSVMGIAPLMQIKLPLFPVVAILGVLTALNAYTLAHLGTGNVSSPQLFGQLILDLSGLTGFLFFTGGATNPLVFLLLPAIAIGAMTLPVPYVIAIGGVAVAAYSLLMVAFIPLVLPVPARAASLHLAGMWFTFVVSVLMIGWFIVRMTGALRQRDTQLAAAREQALRDERVLALGTLAAGAAHELGTPLATLAVLADELEHDGRLCVEAHADLQLMRDQIAYCKRIITGMTERAGAGRGEHAERIPADLWLQDVFDEWSALRGRPDASLAIHGVGDTAPEIVAEPSLEHGLRNLLDNALRAGPPVSVSLTWNIAAARIAVRDNGPGFAAGELARAGRESFPAHGQGSGVGLLLTRSAVERHRGRLHLGNVDGGGALAELEIPVATMRPHD